MIEVPDALQSVLERRRRDSFARPTVERYKSRVSRGDLRTVRPLDGAATGVRLALVLSVDSARDFAEVMLVHTAPELACEADAIVVPELASTSYEVVIETDVRGVVWTWQLGRTAGHVPENVLPSLGPVAASTLPNGKASETTVITAGTPIAGPADPRWSFKKSEGEELRLLARDCTEALLDEGFPWMVDPGLLRPELLDLAADPPALLTDLMHWIATRSLEISASDLEHLLELGVFELDAWAAVGDIGVDVLTALQSLIEHGATLGAISRGNHPDSWRLVTALHLEQAWGTEPDAIHYLGDRERTAA